VVLGQFRMMLVCGALGLVMAILGFLGGCLAPTSPPAHVPGAPGVSVPSGSPSAEADR